MKSVTTIAALRLNWPYCPAGVEWSPTFLSMKPTNGGAAGESHQWVEVLEPTFRNRSPHVASRPLLLDTLETPITVEFINAKTKSELSDFLGKFGFLHPGASSAEWYVREQQGDFRKLLFVVGDSSRGRVITSINDQLEKHEFVGSGDPLSLTAQVETSTRTKGGRLSLQAATLRDFMVMECALVATSGAEARECENCERLFLIGPLTGRRQHSKFCSTKCRVAAMRKRNRSRASSADGKS